MVDGETYTLKQEEHVAAQCPHIIPCCCMLHRIQFAQQLCAIFDGVCAETIGCIWPVIAPAAMSGMAIEGTALKISATHRRNARQFLKNNFFTVDSQRERTIFDIITVPVFIQTTIKSARIFCISIVHSCGL